MAEIPTHAGVSGRKAGHCPVCGDEYEDTMHLSERIEKEESENIPGTAFDHGGTKTCYEWADGMTEQV